MDAREKAIIELTRALSALGYDVDKIEFKPAGHLSNLSAAVEIEIKVSR